jgi:hypothetical protein
MPGLWPTHRLFRATTGVARATGRALARDDHGCQGAPASVTLRHTVSPGGSPRQRDLDTSGPRVAVKRNPAERTLIQRMKAVPTVLD